MKGKKIKNQYKYGNNPGELVQFPPLFDDDVVWNNLVQTDEQHYPKIQNVTWRNDNYVIFKLESIQKYESN